MIGKRNKRYLLIMLAMGIPAQGFAAAQLEGRAVLPANTSAPGLHPGNLLVEAPMALPRLLSISSRFKDFPPSIITGMVHSW